MKRILLVIGCGCALAAVAVAYSARPAAARFGTAAAVDAAAAPQAPAPQPMRSCPGTGCEATPSALAANPGILNPGLCGTAAPPSWCSGLDLGAWINAAGAACSWACTIDVSAGVYNDTTTVLIPLNTYLKLILNGGGASVRYTGSGYFIDTYETGVNPSGAQLVVSGFRVTGTSAAQGAVRIQPSSSVAIENNIFTGFSNGDDITLAGANSASIRNNVATYGKNGLRLYGTKCRKAPPYTCSPTQRGPVNGYAPNANTITQNGFAGQANAGIFEDESQGFHTANLNNRYIGNQLEADATGILLEASLSATVANNYFEGNRHNLVIGNGCCNSRGVVIANNYFTVSSLTPYTMELVTALSSVVTGNLEYGAGSTCFVNSTMTLNDYFGPNIVTSGHPYCVGGHPGNAPTDILFDNLAAPRIPALKATTGTRYVCVDTDGRLISSASPCRGT